MSGRQRVRKCVSGRQRVRKSEGTHPLRAEGNAL